MTTTIATARSTLTPPEYFYLNRRLLLLMTPAVTIDELYLEIKKIQETMVRREDLDALLDTVEILSNPETMAQIQKSEEDIAAGRFREISSIDDLLAELS
jgi:antitoxin YefM